MYRLLRRIGRRLRRIAWQTVRFVYYFTLTFGIGLVLLEILNKLFGSGPLIL